MDKKLIEILAKSPEAAEVADRYINFLYFEQIIGYGVIAFFLFLVVLVFYIILSD